MSIRTLQSETNCNILSIVINNIFCVAEDDALQKVGESEIDKFMFDLLRDDDSCSLSTMLQRNDDLGLSNLLNDDVAPSPPKNCATNNTQEPMNSNSLSTTKVCTKALCLI